MERVVWSRDYACVVVLASFLCVMCTALSCNMNVAGSFELHLANMISYVEPEGEWGRGSKQCSLGNKRFY